MAELAPGGWGERMLLWTRYGLLGLCLLVSVVTDVRRGKILNAVTLPCIVLGLALNTLASGAPGALDSLSGMALGMALPLPLYACRALGAGDVKLLGSVGALLGRAYVLQTLVHSFLAGGAIALVVLLARRRLGATLLNLGRNLCLKGLGAPVPLDYGAERQTLPFAVPIALGAIISFVNLH